MAEYKNKNRGYQQLRVWQDAIDFYKLNCKVFGKFPYQFRTVAITPILHYSRTPLASHDALGVQCLSPINNQGMSRDERSFVRNEEQDAISDFFGGSHT